MNYGTSTWNGELLTQFGGLTEPDEHVSWEIEIEMECTHPGDPGKLYGPPETCYPPEGKEFEWKLVRVFVGDETLFQTKSSETAERFFGKAEWDRLLNRAHDWCEENHEFPEP